MGEPRALDLFCKAGGMTRGLQMAGFHVTGVDIEPQPHYVGDAFFQRDWRAWMWDTFDPADFDVVHASPPCQAHSPLRNMWNKRVHPDLIAPVREMLIASGLPFVIENVEGARPVMQSPILLCGSMFRLGCEGAELRRHRLFEVHGWEPPLLMPQCQHGWKNQTVGVYGHAGGYSRRTRERAAVIGVYGGHGRDRRRRSSPQQFATDARREAMDIDWMTGDELSQAIPPAYGQWIGTHLMNALKAAPAR